MHQCTVWNHGHDSICPLVEVMVWWQWWWRFPCIQGFGGKIFDVSIPACTLFFLFFKVEISSNTPIPLFTPGTVHCGRVFPDELHVCLFPLEVPTLCLENIVSPLQLGWVKGACVFRCNLTPAFLAEWPGSFTCHCGNTGWNGHWISVSTEGLKKRISPLLWLGFKLATF